MLKKRQNAQHAEVETKPSGAAAAKSAEKVHDAVSSPDFYRSVIDAIDAHTVVVDRDGRIVAVNDAWRDFVARNGGRFPDVLEGAKYLAVCETATGSPDADAMKPLLQDVLQGGEHRELSYVCRTPLGNKHFRAAIRGFSHGDARFAIITHHDVTQLQLIAEQASVSEAQLRLIVESSPDCIMRVDRACRVLSVNKAGLALFEANGAARNVGDNILKVLTPESFSLLASDVAAACKDGETSARQLEFTGLRGAKRCVEFRCVRLSAAGECGGRGDRGECEPQVLLVMQDVSWRKTAEELRIGAERREALAQLAGGIAHEFNSMLLAAATYLDGAGVTDGASQTRDPLVVKASTLVQQAQSLSASLLELFAGPEAIQLASLQLQSWLPECVERLTAALPDTMSIRCEHVAAKSDVQADAIALEQVLRILISNASDATEQVGTVRVETASVRDGANHWIEIYVRDNGPGVPERDRMRIFEPFFTTRSRSRRSGLGLAIASRLVEHQGGALRYEPNQPSGSMFVIRLRAM
ncbi:MAG: ATP-binding protein [Phycisphaerales bacterium]